MKRAAIIVSILAVVAIILFLVIWNLSIPAAPQNAQGQTPASQQQAGQETPRVLATLNPNEVAAECKMVPANYVNLSFNTGGLVDEVLVKEGQEVKPGQVLAHLSNQEQAQASVTTAQLDLINAQQALKALYDEAPLRAAEALQALANIPQAVADAQGALTNLQTGVVNQTDIDVAKANLDLADKKLRAAQEAYRPYENKTDDSLTRASLLSRLSQAEKEYDAALRKYNSLIGGPSEARIGQAEADLAVALAQQAEAERRYEILKNGPDPNEVALAQAQVANAEALLAAAQASLLNMELRAPFTGTVASMDLKVGEYVGPGVPVLLLADFANWLVETTDLTELNIVRIAVGAPTAITFDALPDINFNGTVQSISTVGENRQGDITYTVNSNLEQIDERLKWNMTCSISIKP